MRETDYINVNQSYTLIHHPDPTLSKTFWEIGVLQRIAISMWKQTFDYKFHGDWQEETRRLALLPKRNRKIRENQNSL